MPVSLGKRRLLKSEKVLSLILQEKYFIALTKPPAKVAFHVVVLRFSQLFF